MRAFKKLKFLLISLFFMLGLSQLNAADPIITSTPVTTATQGSEYYYRLSAYDVDGYHLYWSTDSNILPSWLTLSDEDVTRLGPVNFSGSNASSTSIKVDTQNRPIVVYSNPLAQVQRWNGSSWDNLGFVSEGSAFYPSLAVDSSDAIYVAYRDSIHGEKISVKKSTTDGIWSYVGFAGFSDGTVGSLSIAVDSSDTPYVVYKDNANAGKVTVKKYNGTSWVNVAFPGFSRIIVSDTSIIISSDDTPYVAFLDGTIARMMRYVNGTWESVGYDFSFYNASFLSVAFDSHDVPYAIYKEYGSTLKVKKFDGSLWVEVGDLTELSGTGTAEFTSIALDTQDNPHIIYKDNLDFGELKIMKFDGSHWDLLRSNNLIGYGGVYTPSITIDSNDTPYIVFQSMATNDQGAVALEVIAPNLSGVPTNDDVGTYDVTVTVSNLFNKSYQSFQIDVTDINDAPTITSTAVTTGTQDSEYIYKLLGEDIDGDALTWSVTSGEILPSWLTLSEKHFAPKGSVGFSDARVDYLSIVLDTQSEPYVVYSDDAKDGKVTVQHFNGSEWEGLGLAGFSDGEATYTSIALDSNDMPYVAYRDKSLRKAVVKKYNNGVWENVGVSNPSNGDVDFVSIIIDSYDTLYIAYQDISNGSKAMLKRWSGTTWEDLSPGGLSEGGADYISMNFDNDDVIFVAYGDYEHSYKATVRKFNGAVWSNVGSVGFSTSRASTLSLDFDSRNTPYVAYKDFSNSKVTVQKFNGSEWEGVGSAGFSDGLAIHTSMVIDSRDIPYVTYIDASHDYKAIVKKYNGRAWADVDATNDASDGKVDFTTIVCNSDDELYIAYKDFVHDEKATVMKLYHATLEGTPTNDDVGLNDVSITLSDGNGLSSEQTFQIDVANVNDAPTITSTPVTTATQDVVYKYFPQGDDIDGDALTWSVTQGETLPSWLTLSGSTISSVGIEAFSDGGVSYTTIAMDSNNIPYVAYQDYGNGGKVTVQKYDGGEWIDVGSAGFSGGYAYYLSIVLDSENRPYVAYRDESYGSKATVKKFNGSTWEDVGSVGMSASLADFTSLAIDNNDTLYIAYKDIGNGSRATVKKFNGSTWEYVGTAGFSDGIADYTSLVIGSDNRPYIAYKDYGNSKKVTVKKFNGSTWEDVGSAGLSAGEASYVSLTKDSNDVLYVVYEDSNNNDKATVKKFNGSTWEDVGSAGFSDGKAEFTFIALDSSDTPFVVYKDYAHDEKVTLKKYDGTKWRSTPKAATGFSDGVVWYTTMAFDSNDSAYVVYRDDAHDSKTTVKKVTQALLMGTPTNDDVGLNNVSITVSDSNGSSADQTFQIDVANVNDAPTVVGLPITTATQGVAYNYTFDGEDIDGDTINWSVTSGTTLPSWLTLSANSVSSVGIAGFSDGAVESISIAIDSHNTLYVAYKDSANGSRATVQKYNGESWESVGAIGFSDGAVDEVSLVISSNDTLYVTYKDGAHSGKTTVKKFDGDSWIDVGEAGFSDGFIVYLSMAVDSHDTPYVAYAENNSLFVIVKKYNGSTWETVGTDDFSSILPRDISLTIDSSDNLYVAYGDYAHSFKITVQKFDGNSWMDVGMEGFSDGTSSDVSIAVDSNDIPYVVYSDDAYGGKAVMKKFDGNSWVDVGRAPFSAGAASDLSMDFDSSDTPYVVYRDESNGAKATLKKYNGVTWVSIGASADLSDGVVWDTSLVLDSSDTPYVVYKDDAHAGKATVMKLQAATLTGTPSNDDVGLNDVNITLSDGNGGEAYQNFQIDVANVDDPPVLEALEDINSQEDAAYFNVALHAYDVDGNPITFSATSSNPDIANVVIFDGKLIIKQVANAYGEVKITVKATANGKSVERDFNLTVESVNDVPNIDTILQDIEVEEDTKSFSIDLNVSDVDGDDLNVTVTSNDTNLLTLTPQWKNPLNQGSYEDVVLSFDVNLIPNANGSVVVSVEVNDAESSTTRTFSIDVLAVNDAPTIESNFSDMIFFKNFKDKALPIGAKDVDGDMLTYFLNYDTALLHASTADDTLLLTSISEASGSTDVNLSVSDGESSVSREFNVRVLPIEEGENIEDKGEVTTLIVDGKKETIVYLKDENVSIVVVEDINESKLTQEIVVGDITVNIVSLIKDTVVEFISDGTYMVSPDDKASIYGTIVGELITKLDVGGKVTEVDIKLAGASSTMQKDKDGHLLISSNIKNGKTLIDILAKEDGTVEISFQLDSKMTSLLSKILGTQTVVSEIGEVESKSGEVVSNGFVIRCVATISVDGEISIWFESVSQTTAKNSTSLTGELPNLTTLPAGSSVEFIEIDNTPYIKATILLDNTFEIE